MRVPFPHQCVGRVPATAAPLAQGGPARGFAAASSVARASHDDAGRRCRCSASLPPRFPSRPRPRARAETRALPLRVAPGRGRVRGGARRPQARDGRPGGSEARGRRRARARLPDNLLRELKTLQHLAGASPHVVELLDHYAFGNALVLVLEPCFLGDLRGLLSLGEVARDPEDASSPPSPSLTLACAKGLVRQILLGVAACHARGVLHRDVKPGTSSSRRGVEAADFGLARFVATCRRRRLLEDRRRPGPGAFGRTRTLATGRFGSPGRPGSGGGIERRRRIGHVADGAADVCPSGRSSASSWATRRARRSSRRVRRRPARAYPAHARDAGDAWPGAAGCPITKDSIRAARAARAARRVPGRTEEPRRARARGRSSICSPRCWCWTRGFARARRRRRRIRFRRGGPAPLAPAGRRASRRRAELRLRGEREGEGNGGGHGRASSGERRGTRSALEPRIQPGRGELRAMLVDLGLDAEVEALDAEEEGG